jgi:hypothetical protein
LIICYDASAKTLLADRKSSTNAEYLRFEHVSGEFFVVTANIVGDLNALFPQIYKAEFRVGADWMTRSVGIRWEEEMREEMIWLETE